MKDAYRTKRQLVAELAQLRERNAQLEKSEAERDLLYRVLDAIPDYHIYAKDRQGRFTVANGTSLINMKEKTREYVLGKTDLDLIPRALAEHYYAEEQAAMESGVGVVGKEVWGTHTFDGDQRGEPRFLREGERLPDRNVVWQTTYTKVPFRDKDGKIAGIACINHNATMKRLAEEGLRRRGELLEQLVAERTAELSQANEQLRREIVERKRAEEELRRNAALDRLRVSVSSMEKSSDLKWVLASVEEALRDLGVPFEAISVQVVDQEAEAFNAASTAERLEDFEGPDEPRPLPPMESPWYAAWRTKRPVYRRDLNTEDAYNEKPGLEAPFKSNRSVLDVPFSLGTIGLSSTKPDAFSKKDIESVAQVGRVLSQAYARSGDMRRVEKSELKYRTVVERSQDVIFQMDLRGSFLLVSPSVQKLTGHAPGEFYKDPSLWRRMVHPKDRDRIQGLRKRALSGRPPNDIEYRLGKGKRVLWVSQRTFPIKDAEGRVKAVEGTLRDITERKQAEEALKESEARYRELYDQAPVGYHEIDQDGSFVRVNRTEAELLGYTVEEMTGRSALEFISPDQRELVKKAVQDKIEGRRSPGVFERRYVRKDGTEIDVHIEDGLIFDEEGRVSGIRSTMQNITERKQAERALRESEQNLRALLDAGSESIVLLDLDGTFVACNKTAARRLGRSPEELVGLSLSEVLPPKLEASRKAEVHRAARTGLPVQFEDKRDGRVFFNSLCPVRDDAGRVTRMAVFATDITKQKEAEKKLMAYEEQLRSLSSEFLLTEERERRKYATALHDSIGALLTLSKMKLGALRESVLSCGLVDAVDDIRTLIEQTIQATRSLTVELSPPVLHELGFVAGLEWLVERARGQFGISIEMETDVSHLPLDEDIGLLLFGSVRELLVNAAKHGKARRVVVSLRRDREGLRITVKDDGVGFDPLAAGGQEARPDAFGLFSIRERMRYVGGQLLVTSKPQQGTQATLVAPMERGKRTRRDESLEHAHLPASV